LREREREKSGERENEKQEYLDVAGSGMHHGDEDLQEREGGENIQHMHKLRVKNED